MKKFGQSQASVMIKQVCDFVQIFTLSSNLHTWNWAYKFVRSWLGERCTNLYTHASFQSDNHDKLRRILPKFKAQF